MKKFMKGSAITGGIFILLGIIVVIVGIAGGGIRDMRQKSVESIAALIEKCDFDWLTEWVEGIEGIEFIDGITISFGGNGFNDNVFDDEWKLYSNGTYTFEDIEASELEVIVGAGSLVLKQHDESHVKLEIGNDDRMQCFVEDDVLKIVGGLSKGINTGSDMVVYLPKDKVYSDVLIDVGAGNLETDVLPGENVVVDAGMGNVVIDGIEVSSLNISVGMGNVEIEGTVNGDVVIECGMGQVTMDLTGNANEFNYELDCGIGALDVEDVFSIAGIGEQTVNNGAEKEIEVSVGMGAVEVNFSE